MEDMYLEHKYVDYAASLSVQSSSHAFSDDSPSTTIALNALAQGSGESQRIGRQVYLDTLELKGFIELPSRNSAANPPADDLVRIMIIVDKHNNAINGTQTTAEVLNTKGLLVNDFPLPSNESRFEILFDRSFPMNYSTMSGDGATSENAGKNTPFQCMITLGIVSNYTGTSALASGITDNAVYLHAIGLTTNADLFYTSRIGYYDN